MATIPMLRRAEPAQEASWQTVGLCERVASVALLTAAAPVLAGSAIALALLSRRTPLIAHRRAGHRGTELWMLKLRTMWSGEESGTRRVRGWIEYIEDDSGPTRKQPADSRVPNRFARFCRRHSIDELPQLWHVIRGEMSLVGPRPLTVTEIGRYYGPDAEEILTVKPGIAGLWQTSGRNRLSYSERRKLDLRFVRNRSLGMYLAILLRTVPEVFSGENSW